MITFEDEPAAEYTKRRVIVLDGPAQLPQIGEHVGLRPTSDNEKRLSGKLVSRSFSYSNNEVHVVLTLRGK